MNNTIPFPTESFPVCRRAKLEAKDDALSSQLNDLFERHQAIRHNDTLTAEDRATLLAVNKVKQIKLEREKCRVAAQIATLDARQAMAEAFHIF